MGRKSLWAEIKTRTSLTSYCHRQSRLDLGIINFIYCQRKWICVVRNKENQLKQLLLPNPTLAFFPSPTSLLNARLLYVQPQAAQGVALSPMCPPVPDGLSCVLWWVHCRDGWNWLCPVLGSHCPLLTVLLRRLASDNSSLHWQHLATYTQYTLQSFLLNVCNS